MSKYINVDKAIQTINRCKNLTIGNIDVSDILSYNDGLQEAINELHEMPSTDVVEVVRCRECKNFEFDGIISFTNDSVGHCKYQPVCTVMLGSDFCSYGERRETE